MGKVILGMTVSLDGFINDRNGSVDRLYPDLETLRGSEYLQESVRNTGAVVMGKNTFAMADDPDSYAGNYEYQVPIFVLCEAAPERRPKETAGLSFTFVTDGIESAIRQAKAAAGDRDVVVVGGAGTARQLLRAGLADELHIDIMPILLTGGLRLFEHLGDEEIALEKLKVIEIGARTSLRFRVEK
jgi:dihydrofolate reductase